MRNYRVKKNILHNFLCFTNLLFLFYPDFYAMDALTNLFYIFTFSIDSEFITLWWRISFVLFDKNKSTQRFIVMSSIIEPFVRRKHAAVALNKNIILFH